MEDILHTFLFAFIPMAFKIISFTNTILHYNYYHQFNFIIKKKSICSFVLVMYSTSLNPYYFPRFYSSLCEISHTFIYIHDGAGENSSEDYKADINITDAKIVRINGFDSGNLFAFALSIYFKSDYVAIMDVDKIFINNQNSIKTWIDISIYNLINGGSVFFLNNSNPVALLSRQSIIRHFLLYTNIKYSNVSALSIFYNYCICVKKLNFDFFSQRKKYFSLCNNIPALLKCDDGKFNDGKYAVLIPTFKRNIYKPIKNWEFQKHKPSQIFVFQNQMHIIFNFSSLNYLTTIPLKHVWCTNWNSLFFLTYSAMMFITEKYYVKIDDDILLNSPNTASELFDYVSNHPNTMVGYSGYINKKSSLCKCKSVTTSPNNGYLIDYINAFVMMYSLSGKIMHRFSTENYLGGEDIAIGFTNSLECNISSIKLPSKPYRNIGKSDGLGQRHDIEIKKKYKSYETNPKSSLWMSTVCLYLYHGYRPVLWSKYKCETNVRNINKIRLDH